MRSLERFLQGDGLAPVCCNGPKSVKWLFKIVHPTPPAPNVIGVDELGELSNGKERHEPQDILPLLTRFLVYLEMFKVDGKTGREEWIAELSGCR